MDMEIRIFYIDSESKPKTALSLKRIDLIEKESFRAIELDVCKL